MRIWFSGLMAVAAGFMLGVGAAWAEPVVTLTSIDGATKLEGELIGFDGSIYTLRTTVGTINVDASQVSCAGEGCPSQAIDTTASDTAGPSAGQGTFGIAGSNILGEGLMPALIQGYSDILGAELVREVGGGENESLFRLTDGATNEIGAIAVSAHGTATAFAALAGGDAAIGLASRRMNGPEAGLADLRDSPDEHILALDGLIVIVHPDNPIRVLALDQIAAVFAGRITSWSALGGPDQPITVYVPDDRSGTLDVFETMVMKPRNLGVAEFAERFEDHADLSDLVSIDPGGIGVTSFAYARGSRMLAIRQQCGLVSFPTSFSMKTEEYPLGRRLYAYGSDQTQQPGHPRGLVDFALSDAAQPIIAEAGFVDRDGLSSQHISCGF